MQQRALKNEHKVGNITTKLKGHQVIDDIEDDYSIKHPI